MFQTPDSVGKSKQSLREEEIKIGKYMCLPSNDGLAKSSMVWSELRANQELCDGLIRCANGQIFYVHRVILSAVSPYFKAIFTSSLKPGTETNQVTIDYVPAEIFSFILDYAYTGTCNVTTSNVEKLLPLADQFEVLGVVQLCCQFLLRELRPENCLGIYKFARRYFCYDLEEKSRRYICQHFKSTLRESSEFKDLLFEELKVILSADELNARNEEIVFDAVKTWVEHDVDGRKQHLAGLLACVRYGLMDNEYFTNNVLGWKLIEDDEECLGVLVPLVHMYVNEANCKNKKATLDLENPLTRPRLPFEILFVVGGWHDTAPSNFIEIYDPRVDRWFISVNTDETPRAYHGLCTLDNLVYMIGGFDGKRQFNTVRCFDPVAKQWKERACMYHARCYVSVCTHGGKIYALGGFNGHTRMNSAERYDPQSNQWEMIPPMIRQRSDASAAALNGKIYVVGGFTGHEILNSAEVFDVETSQWSYTHPMINPRSGVALVAFHDSLYALGGFDGCDRLKSGECYTPRQFDGWRNIPEMVHSRSNFAVAVLDDMIFVVGGYTEFRLIAETECYDPHANRWYDVTPMHINRSSLSACVITGLANVRE